LADLAPEKRIKLLDALEERGTYEGAARKLRITSQTIRNWRADDPELDAECEAARFNGRKVKADTILDTLFKVATDTHHSNMVTAAIFLMKSLEPETFSERIKNEHTGADGSPLTVSMVRIHEPEQS
jgi:hypothetical protein